MSNDEGHDAGHEEASDEVSDEKFDQWLQSAARGYNRPADTVSVPQRDAMWAAIDGALATPTSESPTTAGQVTPLHRRRPIARYWQAAAATVILAAGIGIGRLWSTRTSASGEVPMVASTPQGDARSTPDAELTFADSTGSPLDERRGARLPNTLPVGEPAGERPGSESYDVAAVQHLSRAEALLTSFRSTEGNSASPAMERWARDLLADTRLLLDSPAAIDARRRHLLEDLELVLAQIVQLPAESSADRGLVQRSIERGSVLSRLRTTIPAGFSSGT